MKKQSNKSIAVLSQRFEALESLDDFPTPPWATRALMEIVIKEDVSKMICLEPACNRGYMSTVLEYYFSKVISSDVYDYGYGTVTDFVRDKKYADGLVDWVITNPPFVLADDFILEGLRVAKRGIAMLARTSVIESVGRYNKIFSKTPPTVLAQFTERVGMTKGEVASITGSAMSICWLVWDKTVKSKQSSLMWIPPCHKMLEKPNDYDLIDCPTPDLVDSFELKWRMK